jgi:crotonobetainyl-CoA:carnitine CoA-transferase CaiB-like acyl-CoA transferase
MSEVGPEGSAGFLHGVRVVEIADELGEYCGRVLAGLGADVIKVEPSSGEITRRYGPFHQDDPDPEKSLYFWHYNFAKRGVVADVDTLDGQRFVRDIVRSADVVIDTRGRGYLDERDLGYRALRELNPSIVFARITAFGDDGPWADFKGSDLVHLALGGVMMNCGYDAEPSGFYDTPPIAPQMWQAYHISGQMAALGVMAALNYRTATGRGQRVTTVVHDAVSKNTELDLPDWVYCRQVHHRQTGRHSMPAVADPMLAMTKDGRWVLRYFTYLQRAPLKAIGAVVQLLKRYGMEMDLEEDERYADPDYVVRPAAGMHVRAAIDRLVARLSFASGIWRDAQELGMPWAPLYRPEENVAEEHWWLRETFVDVRHDELGESFQYLRGSWFARGIPWRAGPRAPRLGEHTDEVAREVENARPRRDRSDPTPTTRETARTSPHGKPFALAGVRIVDLSWLLASGGAGRYFTALGAEVVKVEHSSRPDPYRGGQGVAPNGGREERDRATGPLFPEWNGPNRSGAFMEINAGKRSLSLNLKHPRGREILRELIEQADMVIEGFSPGTMARLGLDYEQLKAIKPSIIYVQQSGMGQHGTLGELRSFGPTAQAFSGLSEMSGLPEPYPPAGIGYSYLDWFGAYNMACAMMAALHRRRITGEGCHIDASQVDIGLFLTGTAVLDHSANGRRWSRFGNRSPYKLAAPHGAYRAMGDDRWIAIACFDDAQWAALVEVLGAPEWARAPRFGSLEARLRNQDALDRLLDAATATWAPYPLMRALQDAGVPAGVCQTAQDRYETDEQLRHLEWLTELTQSEIGTWPVKEFPVHFSETPAYAGGFLDRHGPSYGEDNEYVLGTMLGLSRSQIDELATEGVT